MEIIGEAFKFYKNNNYISLELIDNFKNISKIEIFEILENEDKEELISFVKFLQKESFYDQCCLHKDECIICYENKTGILTNCNHFLCIDCYLHVEMRKNIDLFCPMCRGKVIENEDFNDLLNKVFYDRFSHHKMNELFKMFGRSDDSDDDYINYINQYEDYEEDNDNIITEPIGDIDEWANNIEIDYYLSGN